jgi:hypothetical protein
MAVDVLGNISSSSLNQTPPWGFVAARAVTTYAFMDEFWIGLVKVVRLPADHAHHDTPLVRLHGVSMQRFDFQESARGVEVDDGAEGAGIVVISGQDHEKLLGDHR